MNYYLLGGAAYLFFCAIGSIFVDQDMLKEYPAFGFFVLVQIILAGILLGVGV